MASEAKGAPLWYRQPGRWMHNLAERKSGVEALFAMSFADSFILPIPADLLLIGLTVAKPRRWLSFGFWATLGAVVGALPAYVVGAFLWSELSGFLLAHLVSASTFALAQRELTQQALLWLFLAGLSPIPFFVFTLVAGIFRLPLGLFLLAVALGRGVRYLGIALLFRLFGDRLRHELERHPALALLLLLFTTAMLVLPFLTPGRA